MGHGGALGVAVGQPVVWRLRCSVGAPSVFCREWEWVWGGEGTTLGALPVTVPAALGGVGVCRGTLGGSHCLGVVGPGDCSAVLVDLGGWGWAVARGVCPCCPPLRSVALCCALLWRGVGVVVGPVPNAGVSIGQFLVTILINYYGK